MKSSSQAIDAVFTANKEIVSSDSIESVAIESEKVSGNLEPRYLVFSQHGMVDTSVAMAALGRRVSDESAVVIAPNLGYWNTFLSIEPLIATVEAAAQEAFDRYPQTPARIIACSLGGVIWTELLTRHPEWWSRVEAFVLLGSPIGGAHLAKIADPLAMLSFGIAKDLGVDRRLKAEAIAKVIPTLIIAGESQFGGDGTVLVQTTQFKGAQFVLLPGVNHPGLRFSDAVDEAIQSFWSTLNQSEHQSENRSVGRSVDRSQSLWQGTELDGMILKLRSVPGMTDAPPSYLQYANLKATLADGSRVLTWVSPIGVKFVFLENASGQYCFGGYVGLIHATGLTKAIEQLIKDAQ